MWGMIIGAWWLAFGILYFIYKVGEELLGLGKGGGCVFTIVTMVFIALLVSLTEDFALVGAILLLVGFVSLIAAVILSEKGKKKAEEERQLEQPEIQIIRNTLPMPTASQMASFIEEIRSGSIVDLSPQQREYFRMLGRADAGMETQRLDASHFKDMQAAWIYYSKTGIRSHERRRLFGNQNLAYKQYFEPVFDCPDEQRVISYAEEFKKGVENLSAKINEKWCEQPKFAKGFAKMVDESVPISEETLYPLMLESYDRSVPFEKSWMRDDVNDVFSVLYPKMIHILSQILMDRKEEKEWLEIEAFQLRLFPMIQEGKIVKSEELFPILYEVYTEVLLKDYNTQSSRHDFVRLWRGLNAVGKAVGKNASFLNYPKYIIE